LDDSPERTAEQTTHFATHCQSPGGEINAARLFLGHPVGFTKFMMIQPIRFCENARHGMRSVACA